MLAADADGVALIHRFEALRLNAYVDQACLPTIGWGHLITFPECPAFGVDRLKAQSAYAAFKTAAKAGDKAGLQAARELAKQAIASAPAITRERADELFMGDLARITAGAAKLVRVQLNQHQQNALISFTYNLGVGTLKASTLLRRLNAGLLDEVPEQMRRFRFANGIASKGLAARREIEAAMWQGCVAHDTEIVVERPASSRLWIPRSKPQPGWLPKSKPIVMTQKSDNPIASSDAIGLLVGLYRWWRGRRKKQLAPVAPTLASGSHLENTRGGNNGGRYDRDNTDGEIVLQVN